MERMLGFLTEIHYAAAAAVAVETDSGIGLANHLLPFSYLDHAGAVRRHALSPAFQKTIWRVGLPHPTSWAYRA